MNDPLPTPTLRPLDDPRLLWALIMALVIFAASRAFMLDDAFISLRYAENLASGHGLTFNPGERVEGYTNFFWTLLLAPPFLLGIDPVLFAQVLGLACLAGTLALTHALGRRLLRDARMAWLATLVVGLHQSVSAYGTSGLETQLVTVLFLALSWVATRDTFRSSEALGFSLLAAAAVMTRPDSALVALFWLWVALRKAPSRAHAVRLIGPAALLGAAWVTFKLSYYGELLPNTFTAKVGGSSDLAFGLSYLEAFALATLLLPGALLSPFLTRALGSPDGDRGLARLLLGAVIIQAILIAGLGGDFMEFRFMVPLCPWMVLLTLRGVGRNPWVAAAISALLVAWSWAPPVSSSTSAGVEDIAMLEGHLHTPHQDWIGIGKRLRFDLPAGSDVLLATTAAGAIPYYSKLPTLDMLGLTDTEVAREGRLFEAERNHTRMAPMALMVRRGVNLMLGQPWVRRPGGAGRRYGIRELMQFNVFGGLKSLGLPRTARILEIPLPDNRILAVLYLAPHPHIERLIAEGRWRLFRLH